MSTKRRKAQYGNYSRRDQRRVMSGVTMLFALCVALIAMMAVVNRLPIGSRYTYTEASDMWILEGGDMAIAAPEVILYSAAPEVTPTATPSPTPEPSPTPVTVPAQPLAVDARIA